MRSTGLQLLGIARPLKVSFLSLPLAHLLSGAITDLQFEGMLSCQQTQNVIDGKKRIILNPSEQQRKDFEAATFAEDEVWGIDILVSSGEDGKVGGFLVPERDGC